MMQYFDYIMSECRLLGDERNIKNITAGAGDTDQWVGGGGAIAQHMQGPKFNSQHLKRQKKNCTS